MMSTKPLRQGKERQGNKGEGDCPCERAGEGVHRPDCLYYCKPIGEELHAVIEERVRAVVGVALAAKVAEIARTVPRQVFNGDDALFLAWMAGFTAGVHVTRPEHDASAVQIFARCRTMYEKLAPLAAPAGANPS